MGLGWPAQGRGGVGRLARGGVGWGGPVRQVDGRVGVANRARWVGLAGGWVGWVFAILNTTLERRTVDLAGSHLRARRYRAYVEAIHQWSAELGVEAGYLEWVLFRHNGKPLL